MDLTYTGDMALSHIPRAGINTYSAETYVGNWYEETVRNTLNQRDQCMKRDCGDLDIQKKQTMVDMLLKQIELTPHNDGFLHYGDHVQIVCLGPSCKTATEVYPFKRNFCKMGHLALSVTVAPEAVDYANAPYISTDSITTASPLLFPVVRNSFIIERPDCPADNVSVVKYGDVFRVRAFPTQHFPLFLFSAPGIRLHAGAKYSAKPKVRFSDVITSDTLWCAHPLDPMDKLKMELGVPIRLKTRLLIKHNGSGHNLSIEPDFPVPTCFGNELEVSVDSKYDQRRRISFENIWYFDTDRSLPKPTDPCEKAFVEQTKFDAKINANDIHHSAIESAKEEAAAREGGDGSDENQEEQSYNQGRPVMQQMPSSDVDVTQQMMANMRMSSRDGYLPYDKMTAPQPNAYGYTVTENIVGDQNFPNKKWSCGDTECCGIRSNPHQPPAASAKCSPCECIETAPAGESPNAPIPFKRLIM